MSRSAADRWDAADSRAQLNPLRWHCSRQARHYTTATNVSFNTVAVLSLRRSTCPLSHYQRDMSKCCGQEAGCTRYPCSIRSTSLATTKTTPNRQRIVQTARSIGLSGCLLPSIVPQKRVVIDTSAGDVWFLHLASTFQDRLSCDEVIEGNKSIECVNLCFEFSIEYKCVDKISTMIQKAMTDYGSRTSIGVFDEKCFHEDLILVASQKANIIDTILIQQVIVSPDDNSVDPDDLRSLCGELSYGHLEPS